MHMIRFRLNQYDSRCRRRCIGSCCLSYCRCSSYSACQIFKKAFIYIDQTLSARIHNADLFKDRQQIRSRCQGFFRLGKRLSHDFRNIRSSSCQIHGMPGSFLGHGQDGSLHWLDYRFVGCIDSCLQRGCELLGVQFLILGGIAAKPPKQLGQNNSRITAGAHQKPLGQNAGTLADRRRVVAAKLSRSRRHGQIHIGTRIPVRNRKNIQGIDVLRMLLQFVRAGQHHRGKIYSVNRTLGQ
ncbi:hypothetical protein D3C71_1385780 [compost metagenome]